MIISTGRAALPLVAVGLIAVLSSCASESLRERDARDVKVGEVIAAGYTAAVRGDRVHVMVPSGRVDLTLTKPVDEIAAQDTATATPLRPADGAVAVGVAWSLNRGAYPDSRNRQLAPPKTIFGVPQAVRLWLVTDGARREIQNVATMEASGSRPRNATWLIVPAGVRTWSFEVGFAGVTQSVDARTGKVTPGPAAALYRPLPLDGNGSCRLQDSGQYLDSCLIKFAVGYPYVDGAGWAPKGKVFALVQTTIGEIRDAGQNVLVAGTRSVALVTDFSEQFRAFPVAPAPTYAVRGTAPVHDNGRTVTVPLTGSLTPGGTV